MICFTCCILSGYHHTLFAQSEDIAVEQVLEAVAETAGEDFDYTELTERLYFYRKNPININKARTEELQELFFLSPLQINALVAYPKKYGDFIDLLELQAVDGMDLKTIACLLPFIHLHTDINLPTSLKEFFTGGHQDILFRYGQNIERQKGFLTPDNDKQTHYSGSPQRLLLRYRYHYQNSLSMGLNMEKDAGENFFGGNQKYGFDFNSGFVAYKGEGMIKKWLIGDYALQFGQGLSLWSGVSFGKSAQISAIPKQDIGLRPYSSANESLFMRGMSGTFQLKKISFTPFVSFRYLDGNLSPDSLFITSVSQTGFHRTATEIENKNAIRQLLYGGVMQYAGKNLRVGVIGYQTSFDRSFEAPKSYYNQFNFSGSTLQNIGLYYTYSWRNAYFFGETAHSIRSGYAYINGLMLNLAAPLAIVVLHRHYEKNYHSFFNQALAESGSATNENGFYSGIILTPNKYFEISGYADFFKFPWLKFGVDAPSKGYEYLLQLKYSPRKTLNMLFRYRKENKEENDVLDNPINFLQAVSRHSFRGELTYKINKYLQFRNRIEITRYQKTDNKPEWGYMMYQDIIYTPMQSKISGNARFAIFNTQGFNSRIYAYENDLTYNFSIPGFQDRGMRFYFNGKFNIKRGVDLELRYALTNYSNKDEIGSGLDLITGNIKSDIKAQIRFQF